MSLFETEVREKKNQAYNMRAKTGAQGGSKSSKGMNTPYDFMSKEEKKKLNGEVEIFNMNTTILPIEEFRLKDEQMQKTMLTAWREIYDNLKIRKELGISNKAFYDLVAELKIPKKTRIETTKRVAKPRVAKPEVKPEVKQAKVAEMPKGPINDFVEKQDQTALEFPKEEVTGQNELVTKGITFSYDQISDIETLNRILTKCQLLMDGEPHKFHLQISMSEIIGE
jgi:hypothetical protein